MRTISIEQLIGETLDDELRITGVLRAYENRVLLSAEASESSSRHGSAAVILDTSDEPGESFKRFLEARFLDHPNLVHAFLTGWMNVDGHRQPYMAAEFPDAVLGDALKDSPLKEAELVDLTRQLLEGLAYLHSEKLVYGALDVNSVWRVHDTWQLADFSQLRVPGIRPTSETRRLLVRPEISAPPEAYYGEVTPAWDIWSLGALLSKIARPVRKNDSGSPPTRSPMHLPPALEEIITNAASLEPGDRMSASAMLNLLSGEKKESPKPIEPEPPTPPAAAAAPKPALKEPPAPVFRGFPEQPEGRSFHWKRVLQIAGVAVAAFGISLFLARRSDDRVPAAAGEAAPRVEEAKPPSPSESKSPPATPPANNIQASPPARQAQAAAPGETITQIGALMGKWANTARRGDSAGQVSCYAPVVDTYFGRHNVNTADLLKEKEGATALHGPVKRFDVYGLKFDNIGPGWAVISFEKKWTLGGRHPTTSSAREQMVLHSMNGQWKITSERDSGTKR